MSDYAAVVVRLLVMTFDPAGIVEPLVVSLFPLSPTRFLAAAAFALLRYLASPHTGSLAYRPPSPGRTRRVLWVWALALYLQYATNQRTQRCVTAQFVDYRTV